MKEVFEELFTYSYHTNQVYIDNLAKIENVHERAMVLLSHVLNAHNVWLARIEKNDPLYGIWDQHTMSICEHLNHSNYEQSLSLLNRLSDAGLASSIEYRNSKGDKFQNNIRDIFLHIINHSTHHRAQISLILREQGYTPPVSDYIFYKRNQS